MKKPERTWLKFPRAALGLPAETKEVLLEYIERANDKTAETIVSTETIAAKLGVKVRQVQKHRKTIIAAGVMVEKGSRRTRTGHLTKCHKIVYKASSEDVSKASSQDVHQLPKRPQSASKASSQDVLDASSQDARSRCTIYQDVLDQEKNGEALFSPAEIPDDVTLAKQAWNALAEELQLAKISHLTDGRRSKLLARLKEAGGLEGWQAALDKVRSATWMHGANNQGWRVSFDFLLKSDKFAQVLEGAYDQHQTRRQQGSELIRAIDRLIIEGQDHEQ